jgi:predicted alpha/beta-fold hydrolase
MCHRPPPSSRLPSRPLLLGACLLLAGCAGLRPLPSPRLAPCAAVRTAPELWRCLDEIDPRLGAGVARAQPRESAYRSTARVVNGDLRRKLADQDPGRSCRGPIPEGFVAVDETPAETARAPLHAYFKPPRPGMPTVIVVHGLYDSKHSRYVRLTATFLARQGLGVLAPDMRWHGCLLAGWLPTLGIEESRDLLAWQGWLHRRSPASPVGLIGFSLGSLDVVHALAADATGELFRAGGVVVSLPAGLAASLTQLDDPPYVSDYGMQSFIRRFFQSALRHRMETLHLPAHGDRPFATFLAWLVRQPVFPAGTTAENLLARAEPVPHLSRVRRPLLLVASRRDPVLSQMGLADLRRTVAGNPEIRLLETTDGGHIGQPGTYPQWMADLLVRFFLAAPAVGAESPR